MLTITSLYFKRFTILLLITFMVFTIGSNAQSIESITEKISNRICDCLDKDIERFEDIGAEFNRCYDKEFNFIFNIIDKDEQAVLVKDNNLSLVKSGIIPYMEQNCKTIIGVNQKEIKKSLEYANQNEIESFPTNFNFKKLKKVNKWESKIASMGCEIIEVKKSPKQTPYYKVALEDKTIWVYSMIENETQPVGAKVKALGYILEIEDESLQSFHDDNYHLQAFCIYNIEDNQLFYYPRAIQQIKEWINGKVPVAK